MAKEHPKVFLAEDDDDMRALIAHMLRKDGYEVVEARDGAELLELLADVSIAPGSKPDIIVTDVMMPCYSGIGVLGALKRASWSVPVVVITARAETVENAKRLGAAVVFRKPFDVDDLRRAIRTQLS